MDARRQRGVHSGHSLMRVVIDSGVTIEQYARWIATLLSFAGSRNTSVVVNNRSHGTGERAGHWIVDVDAAATGGNRDIHPYRDPQRHLRGN
jgi:hypothetical protein